MLSITIQTNSGFSKGGGGGGEIPHQNFEIQKVQKWGEHPPRFHYGCLENVPKLIENTVHFAKNFRLRRAIIEH